MSKLRLTGDHNQCPGCSEYFNSTFAFDKHRTGDHEGNARRCLTVSEMQARKMVKAASGYWVSSLMPQAITAPKEAK